MSEKYEILKFKNEESELDVNVEPNSETIWMTQEKISKLFGKAVSTINEHIKKN